MAPGDPERLRTEHVAEVGAIEYLPEYIERTNELAKEVGVEPIKPKC